MFKIEIESNNSIYNRNDDSGLLDGMDKISSKISPIDRDKSTVEIEKGEYIFNPNKLTLHKALGNPHSKGGTPVNLEENTFVFSHYKDLAVTKKEKELFEFKKGGSIKSKNNTPSKILEKQIDVKHHNKMLNIINSKSQDDIAKNSAMLMLQKNLEKIGQLAYVQENKKGFPQGIPDFAKNSAPIYDKNTDTQITQSKQYMKHGGYVLPKLKTGAVYSQNLIDYLKNNQAYNMYGETDNSNITNPQHKTGLTYSNVDKDNFKKFQSWYFKDNPNASILDFQKAYNKEYYNRMGENYFDDNDNNPNNNYDDKLGNHTSRAPLFNDFRFTNTPYPTTKVLGQDLYLPQFEESNGIRRNVTTYQPTPKPLTQLNYNRPSENNQKFTNEQVFGLPSEKDRVKKEDKKGEKDYSNKTGLTHWQNFNAVLPLLQSVGVKTQYPYRQQLKPVSASPEYINSDSQLSSLDQSFNNNRNVLRNVSPIQSFYANSSNYGETLDKRNQVIGQNNNQNLQIGNQYNQNQANLMNQTQAQNSTFNKQYYDETQTALKNRDDMKEYLRNRSLTTFNDYMAKNQAFKNKINMLNAGKTDKNGQNPYNISRNFFDYDVTYNEKYDKNALDIDLGLQGDTLGNKLNTTLESLLSNVQNDPNATPLEKLKAFSEIYNLKGKKKLGGNVKVPKINYRNLNITY